MSEPYPDTRLFIDGQWCEGAAGCAPVLDPATAEPIGRVHLASREDVEAAVSAAQRGFEAWRATAAHERSGVLRRAAALLRERADTIARWLSAEQGKPTAQARGEALFGADLIEWFAEEARRAYGRIVPARSAAITQLVMKEPVGPVAAFTPWNFPVSQAVRKVAAALAAGCTVVLKGPEETPASVAALVRAFADAGLPAGALGLLFGIPADISARLIPHPLIRKVSFTGSTQVGKQLAALAGQHMKRVTMELGGHAAALVCADADAARAAESLVLQKYRNAGQTCISPTRILIHESIFDEFVGRFAALAGRVKVGVGAAPDTQMGPLANGRRLTAVAALVSDAIAKGARLLTGGARLGSRGYFFSPTVLADVPTSAQAMNVEPFGPVALLNRFDTLSAAIAEANRLPYGLAAYAYTNCRVAARMIGQEVEAGMISINHFGLGLPELPFGGIKDSGYGSEGGSEAMDAYLTAKVITDLSG